MTSRRLTSYADSIARNSGRPLRQAVAGVAMLLELSVAICGIYLLPLAAVYLTARLLFPAADAFHGRLVPYLAVFPAMVGACFAFGAVVILLGAVTTEIVTLLRRRMGMTVHTERLFAEIGQAIAREAEPLGFQPSDPALWVRPSGWKTDRIELVHRRAGKQTFFVNLHVVLPPAPGSGLEFASLAFVNLPVVSGCSDAAYHVDDRNVLNQVCDDLKGMKDWLAQFDSPSQCLFYLKNSGTKNPEAPVYAHCLKYLSSQL